MAQSLSPFFRSPYTDLTGGLVSHQMLGRCQKEEARYMDCLEAYGLERGKRKCAHLFGDFHECQTLTLQYKRYLAMRLERDRQIAEGKLTGDDKYKSPPLHACPYTDLTGGLVSHQMLGRCQKEEMRYMDCLEAYGLGRGTKMCRCFFDDYHECQTLTLQYKRYLEMRRERDRQIQCGILKGCHKYHSPSLDSW